MTDNRCVEKFSDIYYNEQQSRYWFAGNKKYYNKFQALDNVDNTGISFHVHDDEHQHVSRQQYNVKELLRQRAQQIRNKFDYVRIWYSGGKDSLTIIDSFLEAGCQIDEIATIYTSPVGNDYSLSDIEYTVSDYDLKQRGLSRTVYKSNLETYKKMYVDTENFFYKVSQGQIFLRSSRPNIAYTLWPQTLDPTRAGMSVAEVTGDQKPLVYKKDGRVWFYFLDALMAHIGSPNTEDFYISADMPELAIAQAQGLAQFLDKNTDSTEEWNRLSSTPQIKDKDLQTRYANSYGRNMPSHDILKNNMFGKLHEHLEYSNYKHQCAANELQNSDEGKLILQSYNQQVASMHSKYQFDNYIDTIGCLTKFFSLDSNETESSHNIIDFNN